MTFSQYSRDYYLLSSGLIQAFREQEKVAKAN
jgi:hypothetical protein